MLSKTCVESPHCTKKHRTFRHRLCFDYVRRAFRYLDLCYDINRERQMLAKLSDSGLRDIGVHPADADAECRRSFFDVSADRRKTD